MQDSQKRLRPVVKDPYLLPLETEPTDLINAMDTIVRHSENTGFTENLLFFLQKPIHYLCDRLKINEKQAVLLSVVCELGVDKNVSLSRLSQHFNCSNLNAIAFIKELDELASKSLISRPSSKNYTSRQNVLEAFSINEVSSHEVVTYDTCEKMLNRIEYLAYLYNNYPCGDPDEFQDELQLLLDDNMHLEFTQKLKKYDLESNDQAMLIGACIMLCCHGKYSFNPDNFNRYVDRSYLYSSWNEFSSGAHALMLEGLIEPSCDSGIEDEELFELTKKAKNELLAGVASLSDGSMFKDAKEFIHYKSIVPKDLFFNSDVEEQFNRLSNLMQQEHYTEIHDRLVQNGMRTGFACLFYGNPGTGKTEAALQLARMTGRGIYKVNMADVRSKWVGESEKTVKSIFSQYQSIVNHSEVAPILLLNEADALLGNRFTNVNQSVEKMENTMQNIILEEMERLNGILIATTNLTENLDSAFERRFLFKLRFNNPDANARLHIWESMIPEITSIANHLQLVERYPFSGGQIENIARKCKIESVISGKALDFDMLKTFCDEESLVKERFRMAGFKNAS